MNQPAPAITDEWPSRLIRFSIPTLDELLGRGEESASTPAGVWLEKPTESTSLCLVGPDGTGKSVLAMHLASSYRAQAPGPKILYISTDLSIERAAKAWQNFALRKPRLRMEQSRRQPHSKLAIRWPDALEPRCDDIRLEPYWPFPTPHPQSMRKETLTDCILKTDSTDVAFLDLEAATGGDDWGLLNRIVSTLEQPPESSPRHLLIIDAVEGLEMLSGDRDAFGRRRSRRSRVAQIIRKAEAKCHVVFVVEESKEGDRHRDEEFATDVVLRLRVVRQRDYLRRTVEVEKARSQKHVRGQHDLVIRGGRGTRNHGQDNPDDPPIGTPERRMSYVQVFHSLHFLSRITMDDRGELAPGAEPSEPDRLTDGDQERPREIQPSGQEPARPASGEPDAPGGTPRQVDAAGDQARLTVARPTTCDDLAGSEGADATSGVGRSDELSDGRSEAVASESTEGLRAKPNEAVGHLALPPEELVNFGIRFLDNMLSSPADCPSTGDNGPAHGGLPAGSISTLIGDDGTHKSRLGRAFLSQAFAPGPPGVAVLITTQDISPERLQFLLGKHLAARLNKRPNARPCQAQPGRVICRRLEVHHITPAILFHIICMAVERAQEILIGDPDWHTPRFEARRRAWGPRIRLVIDDWSTIKSTYPEVRDDPLILPFLMFHLGRERISTLIIDTQPGSPSQTLLTGAERDLRALAQHHVYTWHVPFFGERRVAITAVPPVSDDLPVIIRELRPIATISGRGFASDEECLVVDPHFELYEGLEEGRPTLVPLRVRLFSGTPRCRDFIARTEELFRSLFVGLGGGPVVEGVDSDQYDTLRDFSYLQNNAHLDHTHVFQVDEFWAEGRQGLLLQDRYLERNTVDQDEFARSDKLADNIPRSVGDAGTANARGGIFDDPFALFQPLLQDPGFEPATTPDDPAPTPHPRRLRRQFFDTIGYRIEKYRESGFLTDKVPYVWDFGFLLCREQAWRAASDQFVEVAREGERAHRVAVGSIWDRLTPYALRAGATPVEVDCLPVDWREFLGACVVVANEHARREPGRPVPFDIDLHAIESVSSLILEMWASEILKTYKYKFTKAFFSEARHTWWGQGLDYLVMRYPEELYRVCLLLNKVLTPSHFPSEGLVFQRRPARPEAVAARHWFSTASQAVSEQVASDPRVPVALPGRFSVRGDWFLAVAKGSRSPRLAERAVDLLCSRRANINRLQTGLGLPVRDFPKQLNDRRRELLTPLTHFGKGGAGPREIILYEDLLTLGAYSDRNPQGRRNFSWLWRSTFFNYDRHCRIWQKWLTLLMRTSRDWLGPGDGFDLYDTRSYTSEPEAMARKKQFDNLCSDLAATLRRASDRKLPTRPVRTRPGRSGAGPTSPST